MVTKDDYKHLLIKEGVSRWRLADIGVVCTVQRCAPLTAEHVWQIYPLTSLFPLMENLHEREVVAELVRHHAVAMEGYRQKVV